VGHVACVGKRRGFGGKLRGRHGHRWEDGSIEIWSGGMDWIDVAQERKRWQALVNAVVNLWVP
jgi:hypothetical protein